MRHRESPLDRQTVLDLLADRLDERILLELFPDHPPKRIRDLLRGVSCRPADPPPPGEVGVSRRCHLYTDGAARGNPGEAGAGIVLYDRANRELASRSSYLGHCTNNVAEYRALILGLETAHEMGCTELAISLDSELVVRQVQGMYRVKTKTLKPLYARVTELLAGFDRWSIRHVPRSENSRADELANRGIDNKNSGCAFS